MTSKFPIGRINFFARLRSNDGMISVRLSYINILVKLCILISELALQSGHTVFSGFLLRSFSARRIKEKLQDGKGMRAVYIFDIWLKITESFLNKLLQQQIRRDGTGDMKIMVGGWCLTDLYTTWLILSHGRLQTRNTNIITIRYSVCVCVTT